MADSAALRQKRYRLHKRGDHSLCKLDNCGEVTPPVTRNTGPDLHEQGSHGLGRSGQNLWSLMTGGSLLGPMQMVLLLEACRLVDRLDKMDGLLSGDLDKWVSLELPPGDGETEYVVYIDKLAAESRLTAVALKALLAEIRMAGRTGLTGVTPAAGSKGTPVPAPAEEEPEPEVEEGSVADITRRIAARRTNPAAG